MKITPSVLALALVAALMASPAAAKNNKGHGNGHGNGNGNSGHEMEWEDHDDAGVTHEHSRSHDRDILRSYVTGEYKKHCPPGLAKKNPPCIPPGQAKKYEVGGQLPEDAYEPLPDYIVDQLTPPPEDGHYVRVDQNVYLITEGSRKILDAIELFSSVR